MKLPMHISLTIEHNPHAVNYESVADWLATVDALDAHEIADADRTEMLRTEEVWLVLWYPNTPVGHCSVAAATLERALELANEGESTAIAIEERPSIQFDEGPPMRGRCTSCGADLDELQRNGFVGHACFGPGDSITSKPPS